MKRKRHVKYIHEGQYAAEVEVDLIYYEKGWSPCLGPEDALKLDDVRNALRTGNISAAAGLAKIYRLVPVAA